MNKISFHRKLSIPILEQKYLIRILLLLQLIFILQVNTEAEIRYVSKTGTSTPPYLSWLTAADSIQEAIDISNAGDTIYVANGIYKGKIIMIPGISLIGSGMDSCIIDTRTGTQTYYIAVEFADSCLFSDFHMIVSNSWTGSNWVGSGIMSQGETGIIQNIFLENGTRAIMCYNSSTLVRNCFVKNFYTGVDLYSSNSIVQNNVITKPLLTLRSVGEFGVYIRAYNDDYYPVIENNVISYMDVYGVYIFWPESIRSTIRNNVIIAGDDDGGGNAIFGGGTWNYNNLIISNNAYTGISLSIDKHYIFNNVVLGNFLEGIVVGDSTIAVNNVVTGSEVGMDKRGLLQSHVQYNNVWNNAINYRNMTPDSTNISVDPMFVNDDSTQGNLDFHLQMFSPLIDRGDPSILDKDSTRSDIGLYGGPFGESYTYQDLAPRIPRNFTALIDSNENQILLSWNKNTEIDFAVYRLYRDTVAGFQIDSSRLISEQTDTLFLQIPPHQVERLYYKITAVDSQGNESLPSNELAIILTSVNEGPQIISNYILYQNYPNPFNPSTKISYQLKERGYVKLYVYDIKGELVAMLVNQTQEGGYYEVEFTPSGSTKEESLAERIASGIYIYQIMVRGEDQVQVFTDSRKMLYLK